MFVGAHDLMFLILESVHYSDLAEKPNQLLT